MKITVKLFAHFRHGRFSVADQDYPGGADCRQVILDLGFRLGEMGIVMVNGQHAKVDQTLRDSDILALFPLVGGG